MTKKCCVLILAATVVALVLRLPRLQQRPMHTDEAVHADKFRLLLEEGFYEYDPEEYHGPTLNYLTLIPAKLAGAEKLTEVTELTLRIVPVFFGVCLLLLLIPMSEGLGKGAVVYAAVLTAVSPAMVFYSRYYIQEILLVCFTFSVIVSGYRYTVSRKMIWALLTGAFLGLMHATKETCVIAFGAMFLALVLTLLMQRRKGSFVNVVKPSHLVGGIVAGAAVSALFFSSFLTHLEGILDSIRTYTTYLNRANQNSMHIHPWFYYLKMLVYFRYGDGPFWTDALIVLLAIVGSIAALTKKGVSFANIPLVRFLALYTLILTVIYSSIPYKTPWCALSFLHGMILLAGVGAVVLVKLLPNVLPRLIVMALLFEGSVYLAWQAYLTEYKYYADSRNPYVYAHPTTDIYTVVQKIEEYASVHEASYDMPIDIVCPGDDYWPLPWYLRSFRKISWSDHVIKDADSAPLIIATPEVEGALTKKLYAPSEKRQMYLFLFDEPYYVWLRPEVKLVGFVRKDLWDRFQRQPTEQAQPQSEGAK